MVAWLGRGAGPARPALAVGRALAIAAAALLVALMVGVSVGPADLSLATVGQALLMRLPWHPALTVPPIDSDVVWQIRVPRVLLGALVGRHAGRRRRRATRACSATRSPIPTCSASRPAAVWAPP